jgi:hypothetical protein
MLVSIDVGIKNLALCVLDKETIIQWKLINLTYGTDLCTSIIQALNPIQETLEGSTIVIERQMTKKMCNIQCYLEMYFRLKNFPSVIIYSPKYKLAGSGQENSGKGKNLYNARKKASISLCKEWLEKHPQASWVNELWTKTKKKDDISDAFMMALAYQENPICDATQIKKKICARKPTAKQQTKGNYSKSNIKYLLQQLPQENRCESKIDKKLQKNIYKFWPTFADCCNDLQILVSKNEKIEINK